MKPKLLLFSLAAACAAQGLLAQTTSPRVATPPAAAPVIIDRGPHHRQWAHLQSITNRDGQVFTLTNLAYVELATGMHYRDPQTGAWIETQEQIDPVPGGAVARHGQHQATFPNNLATTAVQLLAPDGKQFTSHILGLSYFDASTGTNLLIAQLKDCQGSIVGTNQVLYSDCLDSIKASVRYTYTKIGFEQDIILLESPPSPLAYGLNPDTARLTVLTEFVNPVQPTKQVTVITNRMGAQFTDETLDFGAMRVGSGRAFLLGKSAADTGLTMYKQWMNMEGRYFLIEQIPVPDLIKAITTLPKNQGASLRPAIDATRLMASRTRLLPAIATPATDAKPMRTASTTRPEQGFVLDYQQINTGKSGFTFQADTTYYVSATVLFSGITSIEGGAVIKFANAPAKITLGTISCKTGPYRMAYFTSKDDDTLGETLPDSNHQPASANGATFLAVSDTVLHYLRFSYAGTALYGRHLNNIYHCQFVKCAKAIDFTNHAVDGSLYNVLFAGCQTALFNSDIALLAQHVTADGGQFNDTVFYSGTIINSLFTGCTFTGTPTLDHCISASSSTGYYQPVGAASYYLADTDLVRNTVRNAGSTSIDTTLAADLRKKTTYPPVVLTGNISTDTTLAPQAQRDTDAPDIGAHYDPLDYIVNAVSVDNATLTLTNGVAIGTYAGNASYGVIIGEHGNLYSSGFADRLNRIVRYNTVQEQSTTTWSSSTVGPSVGIFLGDGGGPDAQFRFTAWSMPGGIGDHFYCEAAQCWPLFTDCQFSGGTFTIYPASVSLINCLWERVYVKLDDYSNTLDWRLYNNLFRGGTLYHAEGNIFDFTTALAYDNLFDGTVIQEGILFDEFVTGNNGYAPNAAPFGRIRGNDVTLTVPVYLTGKLGTYYYSTTDNNLSKLIDAGSRNADVARLYHYTVKNTANSKEGTDSTPPKVDIGFHYVAVDTGGTPIDSDGDGYPDYVEDINGNGQVDAGESSWQTSVNGLTSSSPLDLFTPLK